jgi:hypothetical protein
LKPVVPYLLLVVWRLARNQEALVFSEGHRRLEKQYYSVERNGSVTLKKCYCGFVCEEMEEPKAHLLKVHGKNDDAL